MSRKRVDPRPFYVRSPVTVAALATGIGAAVTLGWILLDVAGVAKLTLPLFVLITSVVYGWAGLAAFSAARLPEFRAWLLFFGVLPLLLWSLSELLGAADPSHLVPLFIYCWGIVGAFRQRGRRRQEWQ